jgi:hypothetical protein
LFSGEANDQVNARNVRAILLYMLSCKLVVSNLDPITEIRFDDGVRCAGAEDMSIGYVVSVARCTVIPLANIFPPRVGAMDDLDV